MKAFFSPTLAGLVLLASSGMAAAQQVTISSEQETVIREYVTTHEVQPIEVPEGVTVEIGATLPETVELRTIEAPDVDVEYRYVVLEGRTVLVEPETREIVHIIQ